MVISLAVGCKSDTRQGNHWMFLNFQGKKIWKILRLSAAARTPSSTDNQSNAKEQKLTK